MPKKTTTKSASSKTSTKAASGAAAAVAAPVKDELIDSRVSSRQCKLAVDSLYAYASKKAEESNEKELLGAKEQHIWLAVSTKQIPKTRKIKPVKIPIVYPIVDPRNSSICLITKDPQREYKDLLEAQNVKFISRVVGLAKLKGKWAGYEARRMLLKENDLFLADDRVIPLLPKLLGSKWFAAKKQPIPVCVTRKDLKSELERAVNSTYMHQNNGTYTSIKIGTLSLSQTQILANLKKALPAVAEAVYGGWENVQSLSIKTSTSIALPIWNCALGDEEGGRWAGLTKGVEDLAVKDAPEGDDKDGEKEEQIAPTKLAKSKGKRRVAGDEEEAEAVSSKPAAKKAKSSSSASVPKPAPASTSSKKAAKAGKKTRPDSATFMDVEEPTPAPVKKAAIDKQPATAKPAPPSSTKLKSKTKSSSESAGEPVAVKKKEKEEKKSVMSGDKKKDKLLNPKSKGKGSGKKDLKASLLGKKVAKV